MKNRELENIILDKMKNFSPEVDTDALWQNLESFIPVKKKKKHIGYLLASSLLFGLCMVILYFMNTNSLEQINENNTINKKIAEIAIENNTIEKPSNPVSQLNKTQMSKTKLNKRKVDNSKPYYSQSTLSLQNINTSTNNSDEDTKAKELSVAMKIENGKGKTYLEKALYNIKQVVFPEVTKDMGSEITAIKQTIIDKNAFSFIDNKRTATKTNKNEIIIPMIRILELELLQLKPNNYSYSLFDSPLEIIVPETKKSNRFSWNIGFSLGYFDVNTIAIEEEQKAYEEAYKLYSSSKPLYGVQIGIEYNIYKDLFIRTGLEFSSLTTKLHPNWKDKGSEIQPISGSILKISKEYEAIGHQYFNLIDIPVMVGYDIYKGNRVSISAEIGPVINISNQNHGMLIDQDMKLHKYEESPFDNSFNIGWKSNLSFGFSLSNTTSIYAKPSYSRKSVGFQYLDYKLKQKYNIYDLKVGCRFRI